MINDIRLYAKWTQNVYNVTYDHQNGSSVTKEDINFNDLISKPETSPKDGYELQGWYTDESLTNKWNFNVDTMQKDNLTLYAKWEPTEEKIIDTSVKDTSVENKANDALNTNSYGEHNHKNCIIHWILLLLSAFTLCRSIISRYRFKKKVKEYEDTINSNNE